MKIDNIRVDAMLEDDDVFLTAPQVLQQSPEAMG